MQFVKNFIGEKISNQQLQSHCKIGRIRTLDYKYISLLFSFEKSFIFFSKKKCSKNGITQYLCTFTE